MTEDLITIPESLDRFEKSLRAKLLSTDFEAALGLIEPALTALSSPTMGSTLGSSCKSREGLRSPSATPGEAAAFLIQLRVRSMSAEVLDYFGRYNDAERVISEVGHACEAELYGLDSNHIEGPLDDTERKILKQKVWAVLHLGYCCYRRGRFDRALAVFRLCLRVATNYLTTDKYQSHGTISKANYSIGLVFRERFDYRSAKWYFTESIREAWKARQSEIYSQKTQSSRLDQANDGTLDRLPLINYNIAKSLALGLSFVHYGEGELQLAIPLLLAAQHFLENTRAEMISAYIDVVYACVLRAEGKEPRYLDTVIAMLEKSRRVFRLHDAYRARAAHQLALAFIVKANDPQHRVAASNGALACVAELENYSVTGDDVIFRCYALLIRSRIARIRHSFLEAIDCATEAVELGGLRPAVVAEARLALGEAKFDLRQFVAAEKDFSAALRAASGNLKVSAACRLHLVRTWIMLSDIQRARTHLGEWERLSSHVSTAFLRNLADQAKLELTKALAGEMYRFDWSSEKIDAKQEEAKLHRLLVKWARARTDNDAAAAELLGISRQTLHNWKTSSDSD